jgi:hypothetical protein
MGVSHYYWAVPSESPLFHRLQRDLRFFELMAGIHDLYGGMYWFFNEPYPDPDDECDERDEILTHLVGSDEESLALIADFRTEVSRTKSDHPGVERRCASFQKPSHAIEERLTKALQKNRSHDSADFSRKLLFGNETFGTQEGYPKDQQLGFATVPFVMEAAEMLDGVTAEQIFPGKGDAEEELRQSFERWKKMYIEAARNRDIIFVAIS